MKKLLLNACAIASIAVPGLSFAQADQGGPDHGRPVVMKVQPNDANKDARQDARQDYRQDVRRDVRQDYRQDVRHDVRADFDRTHMWAPGNRFWWRGRPEFVGYVGVRPGFWFIPGRGYIRPDPRWYGYGWRVGGFVPPIYRSYYVPNPYIYGLAPAPYGFRYIYLGNNIVLMSMRDGRIVQIRANLF
jgi:Ni/Co efflux regulator RcnB